MPKLRFKGFQNNWKLFQLGQLGNFTSNGVDKTTNPNETPVFLLNYMDVYKRRKLNLQNYNDLMRVTAKKRQILENNVLKGDVFFTPTSETPDDIGRVHVIEETLPNTVYSYHLMRYRPLPGKFAMLFPNFVFASQKFRKKLFLVAKGVQRFVISKPDFESLQVEIPEVSEQEKIGSFLSAIDRLIEKQKEKVGRIKAKKKGYLQKMFPKDKETYSELRFLNIEDNWNKEKLSELLILIKDGTHGTHINVEKGVYLLSAKNIKKGKIVIDSQDRQISLETYQQIHKNFSINEGDVLLTIVGTIGETALITKKPFFTFQRSVAYLRPGNKLSSDFLYVYINTPNFQKDLKKNQTISAQPGVYLTQIGNIEILFPEIEEQQKIGSFFSAINRLIEMEEATIEQYESLKKGYLQRIFAD
jgi:type I restriction enzyme S subunit